MCASRLVLILLTIVIGGSVAVVDMLPVIDKTETRSCAASVTEIKAEILGSLQYQVNPYLTKRYGPIRDCGGPRWTKLVAVNMSISSSVCPTNFTTFTSPIRSCSRNGNTKMTNTVFPVDQSYSSVCGRVLAIQKGSPDGFGPTFYDFYDPDTYFDGVAISQGSSYSVGHLIWSFVAAVSELPENQDIGCPCAYSEWNSTSLPSFLRSNYFCESGNPSALSNTKVFLDDPLWNGKGCASNSTCCQFNTPPWFYAELPLSTTDDITMTLLVNGFASEENIFIREIEIYIDV